MTTGPILLTGLGLAVFGAITAFENSRYQLGGRRMLTIGAGLIGLVVSTWIWRIA